MNDNEQRIVFSKNLNKYLSLYNKTQKEVADAIGVIPSTFNTWCQGIALPRMGKVQALADYFHINKSDLIDEHTDDQKFLHASKVSILQRAEENEKLTEEQLDDILSYAKYRYPNAFKDNE